MQSKLTKIVSFVIVIVMIFLFFSVTIALRFFCDHVPTPSSETVSVFFLDGIERIDYPQVEVAIIAAPEPQSSDKEPKGTMTFTKKRMQPFS